MARATTAQPFAGYLRTFLLTVAAGAAMVVAVNWVVDPYHLNGVVRQPGLNDYKPEHDNHMLMAKAWGVRRARPEALVVGSSRAGDGYRPDHPGWNLEAHKVYNLGLDGGDIVHVAAYFSHALAVSEVRTVVIGLDFFMFNMAGDRHAHDLDAAILAGSGNAATAAIGYAKAYFSFDTALAAARTVASQRAGLRAPLEHGIRGTVDYDRASATKSVRENFARVLQHFAQTAYRPAPDRRFTLDNGRRSSMRALQQMLDLSRERGVRVHLVINPSHAWDQELIAALGLWDGYEDWKRALVRLVEARPQPAGSEPPTLWDFSGYNTINTEPVPEGRQPGGRMRWFLDAQHFNQQAGDLVLDRVLGPAAAAAAQAPADFGVRLRGDNIDTVLAQTRAAQARYRADYPADVAEIRRIAERWLLEKAPT